MPKPKHVLCQYCGKKFHPKGLKSHEARCPFKSEVFGRAVNLAPEAIYTSADLERERERGRKEGAEQYKTRFSDTQIRALEAAAKAVDAIAHMVGDIR